MPLAVTPSRSLSDTLAHAGEPIGLFRRAVVIWVMALGLQHSRDLTLVGWVLRSTAVLTVTLWVFGIIAASGLVPKEQMALLRQRSPQQVPTDKQADQV